MRNLTRIVQVSSQAERFSSFTLQHLIIAWHARRGRRMLPTSQRTHEHEQCWPKTQRDIRAIQREIRFDAPTQATGMAPQHRPAIRIRGVERRHLRALELVGIGIPRGGSGRSRDREQDQRRRADPRGPPPPPPAHPLRRPQPTRSPRRRSLPRERRRRL